MEMMNARILNPKPKAKAKRLVGNREPLADNIPKARIIEGLPLGNLGGSAIVCKGKMDGRDEPVALKMSRDYIIESRNLLEEELEKSIRLSRILPNAASYYSMVKVRYEPDRPAFAMEIVLGYPILDTNMDCIDAGRLRKLFNKGAIDQLGASLEIASSKGWHTNDLQYFVLLEDQVLNGKSFRRGDVILFDFCDWHQKMDGIRPDFSAQIDNLAKLIHGIR